MKQIIKRIVPVYLILLSQVTVRLDYRILIYQDSKLIANTDYKSKD